MQCETNDGALHRTWYSIIGWQWTNTCVADSLTNLLGIGFQLEMAFFISMSKRFLFSLALRVSRFCFESMVSNGLHERRHLRYLVWHIRHHSWRHQWCAIDRWLRSSTDPPSRLDTNPWNIDDCQHRSVCCCRICKRIYRCPWWWCWLAEANQVNCLRTMLCPNQLKLFKYSNDSENREIDWSPFFSPHYVPMMTASLMPGSRPGRQAVLTKLFSVTGLTRRRTATSFSLWWSS